MNNGFRKMHVKDAKKKSAKKTKVKVKAKERGEKDMF